MKIWCALFLSLSLIVVGPFASASAGEKTTLVAKFENARVSVRVPSGWSCTLVSESLDTAGGPGSPKCRKPDSEFSQIAFSEWPKSYPVKSLEEFVTVFESRGYSRSNYRVWPRITKMDARRYVESVSDDGFVMGGTHGGTKIVDHRLVFMERGLFYSCDLQVLAPEYDESVQADFVNFCLSASFR
jgi:hypothetical protein